MSFIKSMSWQDWTKAGVDATKAGINSYFTSTQKKLQFQQQAQTYEAQAQLNALQAKQSQNAMYNIYRQGSYQAMQQGLVDRAKLGQIRASQSGSGVLMGSGSAKEVENSQKMMTDLNAITIQQNTTSAAMAQKVQTANYLASAEINKGNAQAARTLSKSIDVFSNVLTNSLMAFGDSLIGSSQQGGGSFFGSVFGSNNNGTN